MQKLNKEPVLVQSTVQATKRVSPNLECLQAEVVPFNLPNFVTEKQKEADNVYIVGLDNHVGFIIVENHQVWFLHSSVLQPGAVVKERADTSMALQINYYTVAGNLTADELFLENWILMKP